MPLDHHELQEIADDVVDKLAQTRLPRSPWDRRWNLAVGAIAVVSLVFSLGINWSKVDTNAEAIRQAGVRVERLEGDIRDIRNDLSNERGANMVVVAKLDAIQLQVVDIKTRFDKAFK